MKIRISTPSGGQPGKLTALSSKPGLLSYSSYYVNKFKPSASRRLNKKRKK